MSTNQSQTLSALPRMACSPLRKAFEAWITAPPFERDVTRNSDDATKHAWPGHYREYEVQLAWDAWDAAAATIRETLADPAKTHVLMLRGDIAWTDAGLRHILGDSQENERKKCWHRCQRKHAMKTEPTPTLAAVAPATPCSVVMAQCDTCRDMAEFRENDLPTTCGWSGCNGTVRIKIRPQNSQAQPPDRVG